MNQLTIDFQPGLLEQFPDWMDCVKAAAYGCGKPFKAVAADLDMSVSELSRKLANNPADQVNFPVKDLPALVAATGDVRPVLWLIAKFLNDPDAERKRAMRELNALLPLVRALVDQSGLVEVAKPGRVAA